MRLMFLTPRTVTEQVKNLCQGIKPGTDPTYINITPGPNCEPSDCFWCVKREVERFGGRIQFGWAIWEWPRVAVEAEHHAVYEPGTGPPWFDFTPSGPKHSGYGHSFIPPVLLTPEYFYICVHD